MLFRSLLNFFSDHPAQQFYIQHLGYTHSKPLPNVCELSFNVFYFLRTLTQQNLKASSAKGFGSLNRGQRFHRTWLGYQLWYQNVLDHVIFSLGSTTEDTSYLLQRLQAQPRWQEFQQLLPIYPKGSDHGEIPDVTVDHIAYSAFCNIVSESETEYFGYDITYPAPVATEKTWKPFLSCQIPIFYAAQGHVSYVKQFGFEVFEDILPKTYDSMGTFEKVQAIVDVVAQGNDWIKDVYYSNINKIKHNHDLVISHKVEQLMFDSVTDFVYNTA